MFPIGDLEDILVASIAPEDIGVRPPTPITERVSALQETKTGGSYEI